MQNGLGKMLEKTCIFGQADLEKDFLKKKLNAEHSLVLSKLQLKYDTLQSRTDSLLKIKTEEITACKP